MVAGHARNPWVAGMLSGVLPGAGQFYNRQWGKGAAFLVGFLVLDGVLGVSAGFLKLLQAAVLPEDLVQLLLRSFVPLAVAIWSVVDAARTARNVKEV